MPLGTISMNGRLIRFFAATIGKYNIVADEHAMQSEKFGEIENESHTKVKKIEKTKIVSIVITFSL